MQRRKTQLRYQNAQGLTAALPEGLHKALRLRRFVSDKPGLAGWILN